MKSDFLVIGSGSAGLSFALKVAVTATVTIVTKGKLNECNTNYAQGGICSVTYAPDTFEKHIEDTLVCGAGKCDKKVEISPLPTIYEDNFSPSLTQSRAFIKVQDGCNNFCSYCIIPYLRGRSRSRQLSSIVEEAKSLIGKTRELVITGINVSAYGKDISLSLVDLIKALGVLPMRKRFGSLLGACG